MNAACAVCQNAELRFHIGVERSAGASLVATTTRYGAAPADIFRCSRCGHMQVAELPLKASLEEEYSMVDEDAYLDEEAGQRATAARALERIERHLAPAEATNPTGDQRPSICDLGCWVGFLLAEAEDRGWAARGVEPSEFAARYAREHLGLDVMTGTLATAELPLGVFDAVVMADVIEHLPAPGEALDRVSRLLRPGGVLYLALPDAGSRVARRLGSRWWSVLPTHVQYFTRSSLARLLADRGYTVEWMATAPKAFTVRYYLERLEGYSVPLSSGGVRVAERIGLSERIVWPDFRDRVAVLARSGAAQVAAPSAERPRR